MCPAFTALVIKSILPQNSAKGGSPVSENRKIPKIEAVNGDICASPENFLKV